MYKAKTEFLWYKIGDEIKEEDLVHIDKYLASGLVSKDEEEAKEVVKEEIVIPKPKGKGKKRR